MLTRDINLEHLEAQDAWEEAVTFAYRRWKAEPDNLQFLLRAGTEAWFANAFDVFVDVGSDLPLGSICVDELPDLCYFCEDAAWETFLHGQKAFSNEPAYLMLFGYMMHLYPYYFAGFSGGEHARDFDWWAAQGQEMMEKAARLRPEDTLIRNAPIWSRPGWMPLKEPYFSGKTAVEGYFNRMLTHS